MEFWESAEVHKPAYDSLVRAGRSVEQYLNSSLSRSSLSQINLELLYIPIVMPVEMHDRYKERSKARIKQRVYDCAPQLDYELFVSGSFEQQLKEYARGIALSIPHLHKFGLTLTQVEEFKSILDKTVDQILEERPDQARH